MRIFLVRHGESMGNVDKNIHHTTADHAIPLSPKGIEQAKAAGEYLNEFAFEDSIHMRLWTSPYKRTRQTSEQILKAFGCEWADTLHGTNMPSLETKMVVENDYLESMDMSYREHHMLCEQQFGLFDGLEDDEREVHYPKETAHYNKCMEFEGRFWARMPLGESRFDVANRVHQSFGTFHRDLEKHGINNIIVVCHGVTLRAFVMQWMHLTPEWFDDEPNPGNCWVRCIDNGEDKGYLFKP